MAAPAIILSGAQTPVDHTQASATQGLGDGRLDGAVVSQLGQQVDLRGQLGQQFAASGVEKQVDIGTLVVPGVEQPYECCLGSAQVEIMHGYEDPRFVHTACEVIWSR